MGKAGVCQGLAEMALAALGFFGSLVESVQIHTRFDAILVQDCGVENAI